MHHKFENLLNAFRFCSFADQISSFFQWIEIHYVAEAAGEKCRFTNEKIEFRENSVERKWTLPFNRHFIEKHLFVRCIYNSLEATRE